MPLFVTPHAPQVHLKPPLPNTLFQKYPANPKILASKYSPTLDKALEMGFSKSLGNPDSDKRNAL
jgi:hypothetical protein